MRLKKCPLIVLSVFNEIMTHERKLFEKLNSEKKSFQYRERVKSVSKIFNSIYP